MKPLTISSLLIVYYILKPSQEQCAKFFFFFSRSPINTTPHLDQRWRRPNLRFRTRKLELNCSASPSRSGTVTVKICPERQCPGTVQTNVRSLPASSAAIVTRTGDTSPSWIPPAKSQLLAGLSCTLCGSGPSHSNTRVSPTLAVTGGSSGSGKGITQFTTISSG